MRLKKQYHFVLVDYFYTRMKRGIAGSLALRTGFAERTSLMMIRRKYLALRLFVRPWGATNSAFRKLGTLLDRCTRNRYLFDAKKERERERRWSKFVNGRSLRGNISYLQTFSIFVRCILMTSRNLDPIQSIVNTSRTQMRFRTYIVSSESFRPKNIKRIMKWETIIFIFQYIFFRMMN